MALRQLLLFLYWTILTSCLANWPELLQSAGNCQHNASCRSPLDDGLDQTTLLQVRKMSKTRGGIARGNASSTSRWHPMIHDYIRQLELEADIDKLEGLTLEMMQGSVIDSPQATDDDNATVLFVVMTDSNNYDKNLQWISNSWGQDVDPSYLMAIGDAKILSDTDVMRVERTKCPAHSHDGACCKMGEALLNAHAQLQKHPNLNWAYIVDDDAYVRPAALARRLSSVAQFGGIDGKQPTIFGMPACGNAQCPHGYCGGGGAAFSRPALASLMEGGRATYFKEHMAACDRCGMYGDVTTGELAHEHKIYFEVAKGLNGWQMKKPVFEQTLKADFEPLMYHYIKTEGQMQFLHRLFSGAPSVAPRTVEHEIVVDEPTCATYKGNKHCQADDPGQDLPWDP